MKTPSLLIFGAGYLGLNAARAAKARGMDVRGTSRDAARRAGFAVEGIVPVDPQDGVAVQAAVATATAILITAPPDASGCPGLRSLSPALGTSENRPDWIGYVSSTAVYGDREGGWVFEDDALNAASLEGGRRVRAEAAWRDAGQGMGLTVQIFRLPGIYGPGRSVVDRLRDSSARIVRKPGQIFNRVHVDDAVAGMFASIARPRPGAAYNLTDDEPSSADVVMSWAAERMGLPAPPEVDWTDPSVSDAMRRFYLDSKRISNARAKAELGWRPMYPSWREGLEADLAR